eukprot:2046232-Pyramimonas_sp.AAC.1
MPFCGPAVALRGPFAALRGPVAALSGPSSPSAAQHTYAFRGPRSFAPVVAPCACPSWPRCRRLWPLSLSYVAQ